MTENQIAFPEFFWNNPGVRLIKSKMLLIVRHTVTFCTTNQEKKCYQLKPQVTDYKTHSYPYFSDARIIKLCVY